MVCETCHGKCCTKFLVFVTAHDISRIAKKLGLDPIYFVDYYTAGVDTKYPSFKINKKEYVRGLDTANGQMRACKFLIDLNGHRRCGIHDVRPMGCRSYPFVIKKGELDFGEQLLCPKQWWPEGEERERYVNDIYQHDEELAEYKNMVREWNKESKGTGNFVEFLYFITERVK